MFLKRISSDASRLLKIFSHSKIPISSLRASMLTFHQHKYFSNVVEKQENFFEEGPSAIKLQDAAKKVIPLGKPQEKRSGAHILYYGKILMRVSKTCQIYLKSPVALRDKVEKNSRFYYVRQKLDLLNDQEKERFQQYLNQINEIFSNHEGKNLSQSEGENNLDSKKPKFRLRKKDVMNILDEPENGILLRSLILDFLDPENRDFDFYLDKEEDEVAIGEVTKQKKYPKRSLTSLLMNDLGVVKSRFRAPGITSQTKADKKKVQHMHSSNYAYIVFRVMKTCQTYLKAPEDKKANVETNSRYYYVKEILDKLSVEQRSNFEAYLNQREYYFYGHHPANSTTHKAEDYIGIKPEDIIPNKYNYTSKKPQFTKKGVGKYLEEPTNGPLLKSLILEFLKLDNVDRVLYLDPENDEVDIGRVVATKKPKRKFMSQLLNDDLEFTIKRFEDYNKTYIIR